jgi:hypothetical protein
MRHDGDYRESLRASRGLLIGLALSALVWASGIAAVALVVHRLS